MRKFQPADELLKSSDDQRTIGHYLAFIGVGITATFTHYASAISLIELFRVDVYSANIFSYLAALLVSYFGHSIFSFEEELRVRVFLRFLFGSVAVFLFGQLSLFVLSEGLALHPRISMALVVLITTTQSYLVSRFWIYRKAFLDV